MRWTLIILSFIFYSHGYTQSITLSVLGRTSYITYPDSFIYKISNAENGHSSADFDSLKFILDSLGVLFRMDSMGDPSSGFIAKESIDFYTYSLSHFEMLKEKANQMEMYGDEKFEYANNGFTYQDTLISLAYHDALKRAKIMAQYLGKKITGVRNIDDHVERYLFHLDLFPELVYNIDEIKDYIGLLEFLSAMDPTEPQVERKAHYTLWVTFEVK
jgi:hypothetical protein